MVKCRVSCVTCECLMLGDRIVEFLGIVVLLLNFFALATGKVLFIFNPV